MLSKVMKYEWKAVSKLLLILHVAVAVYSILTVVAIPNIPDLFESVWGGLFITLYILLIGAAGIFTMLIPAIRFYRSMYQEEGYLTHSVPVSSHVLVSGRLLIAFFWALIDCVVVTLTSFVSLFCILDLGDIYEEVGEALGNVLQIYAQAVGIPFALLILFIVLGVLLSLVFNILTIYVSIALGCMLKNHRAVMSMVFYFILLCVYQVLGSFISVFLVSYLKDLPSHRYPADKEIIVRTPYGYNLSQTEIEVCRAFFFTMLALFVIGALLCVGYYFIIVKADEKKLELQ